MRLLAVVLFSLLIGTLADEPKVIKVVKTTDGTFEPLPEASDISVVCKEPCPVKKEEDPCETSSEPSGCQTDPCSGGSVCATETHILPEVHKTCVATIEKEPPVAPRPIVVVGGGDQPAEPVEEGLSPSYLKGWKDGRVAVREEEKEREQLHELQLARSQELDRLRCEQEQAVKLEEAKKQLEMQKAEVEAQTEFWAEKKQEAYQELCKVRKERSEICQQVDEEHPELEPCPCVDTPCDAKPCCTPSPSPVAPPPCSPSPLPPCPCPSSDPLPPCPCPNTTAEATDEDDGDDDDDEDDDDDDDDDDDEDDDDDDSDSEEE